MKHAVQAPAPRGEPGRGHDMTAKLHTAGEPLLRILAVLDGGR
jgi:hypothetical protein